MLAIRSTVVPAPRYHLHAASLRRVMKVLLGVIALGLLACGSYGFTIPEQAAIALRNAGIATLNKAIGDVNAELTNAVTAYKAANASCGTIIQSEIARCTACVRSKCEARAKSVCDVDGWQKVLAKGIDIVKSVPEVLLQKIPQTVLKTAPNALIEAAKDVHGFLKEKVVDKVVDTVKDVGDKVVDTIKDAGSKIGTEVRRIFRGRWGKRRIRGTHAERLRRNAEPSCDALKSDPQQACQVYLNSAHCPNCGFNPMTGCPGYASAVNRVEQAQNNRQWLDKATNKEFNIVSFTYDGTFSNAQARVQLFGKDFTISLGTLNPYDANNSGPVVASRALDMFKRL